MTKKQMLTNATTIIGTGFLVFILVWMYINGYFTSPEKLQDLLKGFGLLAPLLFIAIQIIQVIIPIIPGGVSSAIGVLAFGPFWGFLYNYAGLVLGSIAAFLLVRKYGKNFILKFADEAQYNKYIGWLDKGNKFTIFFASAIFLPCAPDDLLCMIAGLTNMKFITFFIIILLGKPLALIAYSMGLSSAMQWLFGR